MSKELRLHLSDLQQWLNESHMRDYATRTVRGKRLRLTVVQEVNGVIAETWFVVRYDGFTKVRTRNMLEAINVFNEEQQ